MASAILARGFVLDIFFTPYLNANIDSNVSIRTYEDIIVSLKPC